MRIFYSQSHEAILSSRSLCADPFLQRFHYRRNVNFRCPRYCLFPQWTQWLQIESTVDAHLFYSLKGNGRWWINCRPREWKKASVSLKRSFAFTLSLCPSHSFPCSFRPFGVYIISEFTLRNRGVRFLCRMCSWEWIVLREWMLPLIFNRHRECEQFRSIRLW